MNKTVLRKKSLFLLANLMMITGLLLTGGSSYGSATAAGMPVVPVLSDHSSSPIPSPGLCTGKDTIRSIRINKIPGSKKYKIRLYPDARRQVLFFSANGEAKKVYQLYMFDMEGKLVNQASIRNRETTVLENISEGNYLFEVFSNDQRIVNGQVTVQ